MLLSMLVVAYDLRTGVRLYAWSLRLPDTGAILGWRRATGFAVASTLLIVSVAVDPLLATVTSQGDHEFIVDLWPGGGGCLPQVFPGGGMRSGLAPILQASRSSR